MSYSKASTSHYYDGNGYSLGDVSDFLSTPLLSLTSRLRFLLASAFLKTGIKKYFGSLSAIDGCNLYYGTESTLKIWQPLIIGKFNNLASSVPMSWLASRIRDRSIKLGYYNEGFSHFYQNFESVLLKRGVKFFYNTPICSIKHHNSEQVLVNDLAFDHCLSTLGPYHDCKLGLHASENYRYLGALCVIFELLFDPCIAYWTNFCDPSSPVLAVINHRALDPSDRFGSIYPIYSAAYLPDDSDLFSLPDSEISKLFFLPLTKLVDSLTPSSLSEINVHVFRSKYAQPLINPNLGFHPLSSCTNTISQYSMHSVYPNDRGQNYALKLGRIAANNINNRFQHFV